VARLIIVLTVVPLLELYLLFEIGAKIGFFPTVAFTILTAMIGSALARRQALAVWSDWSESMQRLESPAHSVLEGLMILVGGVLLLTPGFLTDGIGFLLLIPWTRALLLRPLRSAVDRHLAKLRLVRAHDGPFSGRSHGAGPVVDTTAVDVPDSDDEGRSKPPSPQLRS
jgi:UPF0716 protein FxsA